MHIFPETLIRTLTRVILALFASTTVLVPIVLFSLVKSQRFRLALIVPSVMIFVGVLSLMARPKVSEIFIAGATYVETPHVSFKVSYRTNITLSTDTDLPQ